MIQERSCPGSSERNSLIRTGRILHLDGDKYYADKSARHYRGLGLTAIVKNIPEYKQPTIIRQLLEKYKPDILVITGHDGMIKNNTGYNDIYNYRNSGHFIRTVMEARRWRKTEAELAIFAGACQSYFEAIMNAGANFASSPGRVLIDFVDPLVVAEKVAVTDVNSYVTMNEIVGDLREGIKGVGGNRARGRKKTVMQ